jgi:NADH:ubiquinone oxidoreductase subunit H
LMNIGWRWMIPLALANLIVTAVGRYLWLSHHAGTAVAWLSR